MPRFRIEDRKVAFNRVGMSIAANVLFDRVVDSLVARKAFSDPDIDRALVGAKVGIFRNRLKQGLASR
jgi:hypothetical protein